MNWGPNWSIIEIRVLEGRRKKDNQIGDVLIGTMEELQILVMTRSRVCIDMTMKMNDWDRVEDKVTGESQSII